MARVNVELKARDSDPEATAARCRALGASDEGVLEQRDTYFLARRARLKLRDQGPDGAQLIAWGRPDVLEPTESTYVLAPVAEVAPMAEALKYALGPPVVVVAKRRHLFLWQGVRIHLDEVDQLGTFLEFEAVLESGADPDALAAAHDKVARLRQELGVEDGALVAGGYANLLLDSPQALLRAADAAMRNAYAPYSEFKVGAAVRGASGAIYAAANVENAAYPQSQCAEASAIGVMVAAGETALTAVAVVGEKAEHCSPCGGCRQRLSEFGSPDTPVHMGRPGETPLTVTLGDLLPGSFGREALEA
ncbi:MAG TPA: cytidine deaminase [Solirubrobacteraceae bacterium]|nr:cytidine deaminase [Solirubrobacteraceae bacterium]